MSGLGHPCWQIFDFVKASYKFMGNKWLISGRQTKNRRLFRELTATPPDCGGVGKLAGKPISNVELTNFRYGWGTETAIAGPALVPLTWWP